MDTNDRAMESLVKGIDYLVQQSFDSSPFDRTYSGVIISYRGNDRYNVQINGTQYDNVPSMQSDLEIYSTVKIVIPQGNMNNMFILGCKFTNGSISYLKGVYENNIYKINGDVSGLSDANLNLLQDATFANDKFTGTLHNDIKVKGDNVISRAALFSSSITANPTFNGTLTANRMIVQGIYNSSSQKTVAQLDIGTTASCINSSLYFRDLNRTSGSIFAGYANDAGTWYLYDQAKGIAMIQNVNNGAINFNGSAYNASSYVRARTLNSEGTVVSYSQLNNDGTIQSTGNVTSGGGYFSNRENIGFSHTHPTTNRNIALGVGSGGSNRGIWDGTSGINGWVLYRKADSDITYLNGHFYPDSDNTFNLGTTTARWRWLYCELFRLYRDTDYYYQFGGTPTANRTITFQNASGTVAFTSSDARLKENIKDTTKNGLDIINQITVRQFDWKDNDDVGYNSGTHQDIGFIADELEKIDSRFVVNGSGGYNDDGTINPKCIDTFYLVGYLTKAVQELSEEINKLKESEGLE